MPDTERLSSRERQIQILGEINEQLLAQFDPQRSDRVLIAEQIRSNAATIVELVRS